MVALADASALDVPRSFGGQRWQPRLEDARQGLALAQRLDVPEIIGRAMAGRGIGPDEAELFLNPSLRSQLPDPGHLKDMAMAARRPLPPGWESPTPNVCRALQIPCHKCMQSALTANTSKRRR